MQMLPALGTLRIRSPKRSACWEQPGSGPREGGRANATGGKPPAFHLPGSVSVSLDKARLVTLDRGSSTPDKRRLDSRWSSVVYNGFRNYLRKSRTYRHESSLL